MDPEDATVTQGREGGEEDVVTENNSTGEGKAKMPYLGQAREQAAAMLGVSPRYVSDAKKVKEEVPEAFDAMRDGTVTMPQAQAIAAAPVDERPALIDKAVRRHTTLGGKPESGDGALSLFKRVRPNLTIDQRARYQATVYRVLRVTPWRAIEVLLEFGVLEKMTVATLLRLCRETRHDEGLDGDGAPTGGVGDAGTGHEHNGDSDAGGSERKAGAQ